jgi:transposase
MRQISRELDRLELIRDQINAVVEVERNALLAAAEPEVTPPAKMLLDLKGIGVELAMVLWTEGLLRQFDNRRQVVA